MQPLDALRALDRLAVADTTDRVGALSEATRIVGAVRLLPAQRVSTTLLLVKSATTNPVA